MLKLVPSVTMELMEQLNLTEMVAFNADFDHIKGSHLKRGAKRDFAFRIHSGVGWRALTCAGVCLNQAERSLVSRKTMMGQAETKHTLLKQAGWGRDAPYAACWWAATFLCAQAKGFRNGGESKPLVK
jgi:hypothetical protein